MSANILKIHDLLSQFDQNPLFSPIDFFFFGYLISTAASTKIPNSNQFPEDLVKKIHYINTLYLSNIISQKQKLMLFQEIMDKPIDKIDYLIDKAMDQHFGANPNKLQKVESQEEHKLSEDYITKMMEEEEKRHKDEIKASEELAKKILDEEKKNQDAIREIKARIAEENVDCPICLGSLFSGDQDVWGLYNCQHCFHKVCLNPYLEAEISNKRFPIKCPMDNCKSEIANEDLMENIEKDIIDKYFEFTLKNYVDIHGDEMSWCPTADCSYAFIYDKDISVFNCPRCNKSYCLNCRVPEHKGMTCKEYQINSRMDKNDQMFFDFVRGHKFKQCTQCQYWVEKNEGCDHMTCRCGYQFCYKCGGKYQECECVRAAQNNIRPNPPAIRGGIRGGRGNIRRKK